MKILLKQTRLIPRRCCRRARRLDQYRRRGTLPCRRRRRRMPRCRCRCRRRCRRRRRMPRCRCRRRRRCRCRRHRPPLSRRRRHRPPLSRRRRHRPLLSRRRRHRPLRWSRAKRILWQLLRCFFQTSLLFRKVQSLLFWSQLLDY